MVELDAADKLTLERAKTVELSRDYKLAKELYKELLNKYTDDIDLLSALGNIYEKTEEYPLALSIYEKILSLDSSNLSALNSLGSIYRHLKQYRESIASLERGIIVDETDPQVFYNLGLTYKDLGRYAESSQCFNMVISQNPNDVLAYNHLGSLYALQEQYPKAVQEYLKALKIDPNHPNLHLNLAHTYEKLNEQDKALLEYESALRSKPGWLEAIDGYADLPLKKSNLYKARNILSQAVRLNPSDAKMHTKLGNVFSEQRVFDSAESEFKDALNIAPDNTDALSGLADAYESEGKIKEALSVMEKYEELSPEGVDMLRQYASILLSADKLQHAMDKIKILWDKDSQDKHTLNLLGQYYICNGEENKAKSCFDKITKIDPDYVDHLYDGARRYTQKGQHAKAESHLKKYLEHTGDDIDAISLLATNYESQDRLDDALEMYKRLSVLDSSNKVFTKNVDRVNKAITERASITNPKDGFADDIDVEDLDSIEEDLVFVQSSTKTENKSSSSLQRDSDLSFESLMEDDDGISPFESEELDDDIMASNIKPDSLESITPEKDSLDDLFRANSYAPRAESPYSSHQPRQEEPFAEFVDEDVRSANDYDPETVDLDDGTVINEDEEPKQEPKKKPKPKQEPVPEEEVELEPDVDDVDVEEEYESEKDSYSNNATNDADDIEDVEETLLSEDDSQEETLIPEDLSEDEPESELEEDISIDEDLSEDDIDDLEVGEFTTDEDVSRTEEDISEYELEDAFTDAVPEDIDDDTFASDTVLDEELTDTQNESVEQGEEKIPDVLEDDTLELDSAKSVEDPDELEDLESQGIPLELDEDDSDPMDILEEEDFEDIPQELTTSKIKESIPDELQELPTDAEFENIFDEQDDVYLATELPDDIGLMMDESFSEDSLPEDIPLMLEDEDLLDGLDSLQDDESLFEDYIDSESIPPSEQKDDSLLTESNATENRLKQALTNLLDKLGKDLAKQPPSQIENLFVKLRSLVEFLPENVRGEFLSSKEHLQLEYLIFKMRGNPGLCSLVNSVRKELDLPEETEQKDTLSVNSVESVFTYLKQLVADLPNKDVSSSIEKQIENILVKLEDK